MLQERATAGARSALGPTVYEEHLQRGRSLAVDEVVRPTPDTTVADIPGR